MVWFLGVVIIYLLLDVLLIAVGLVIGFVLHWLVPEIDMGIGTLIGIVSTGLVIYFLGRVTSSLDEETADTDSGTGPQKEDHVYPYAMLPLPRRRSRRRR